MRRVRAMATPALSLAVAVALTACAAPAIRGPEGAAERPGAASWAPDASAFVAAELAFARLAQERGQWTAFRATAAPDAMMFVPGRVRAQDWLRGRADPPAAVRWQPHAAFVACDGSAAATTGAAQWPGAGPTAGHGLFTTVWARQPGGDLRWVLDHGAPVPTPRPTPDAIATRVAACTPAPPATLALGAPDVGADRIVGQSRDRTLRWTASVAADGARVVRVDLWDGAAMVPVITDSITAADAAR